MALVMAYRDPAIAEKRLREGRRAEARHDLYAACDAYGEAESRGSEEAGWRLERIQKELAAIERRHLMTSPLGSLEADSYMAFATSCEPMRQDLLNGRAILMMSECGLEIRSVDGDCLEGFSRECPYCGALPKETWRDDPLQ